MSIFITMNCMRSLSKIDKEINLLETDLYIFLDYSSRDPFTFKGFTDVFYKDKALREHRYSRFGECITRNIHSVIKRLDSIKTLLEKQKKFGFNHGKDIFDLINKRKGFLDRKCDELLIAVYDFRIEDMEIDKLQLKFILLDTLERLKSDIVKYSLSIKP